MAPGSAPGCALGFRMPGFGGEIVRLPRRVWLLTHGRDLVPIGGQASVTVTSGAVWVGVRLKSSRGHVRLKLAGSDVVLAIRHSDVRAFKLLPKHSYAERRQILARQRAGEPAARVQRRPRKEITDV